MGLIETTVIGAGLAMDAVAVSMTDGMVYSNLKKRDYLAMILFFSIFQGLMPLMGYCAGTIFARQITAYSSLVIFLILGIIGCNMIRESLCRDEISLQRKKLTSQVLFFQAVATSIDAFAVGVGFCAVRVEILPAVAVIGAVTAFLVFAAVMLGRCFGDVLGQKAELLGGIILIIIGLKGFF